MDEQIARLAEKLRLLDDDAESNPPLPEAKVAEFEQTHGIRLPEAYRRFLVEIGDGDEESGLYSLADGYAEVSWADDGTLPGGLGFLAQPSRFRKDESYTWRWWNENYGPDERPDQLFGTLPVAEGGCSDFYFIVLNGPDAGAVYTANWDGNGDPARMADDYLSWQESIIDGNALSAAEQWDGEDEDPDTLLAQFVDSHEYQRMWAVLAVRHPPTERMRDALRDALLDRHFLVRSAALTSVGRGGLTELVADVRALAGDERGSVRWRALRALEQLDDPELAAVARGLITDDSPSVRRDAVRLLGLRDALTIEDVHALLDDPEWTVRREAMRCLPGISGDPHDVLMAAAANDQADVRRLAIDQAAGRGDRKVLALLPDMIARERDLSLKMHLEWVQRDVD